jgi:hypothetical protein
VSNLVRQEERDRVMMDLANAVQSGICSTIDDIVNHFPELNYQQAALIMNDPQFISFLNNFTRAKATLGFAKGISNVAKIVDSTDNKEVIQATKLLGEFNGQLKNKVSVNVQNMNMTLEDKLKKLDSKENVVENQVKQLKQVIDESQVIDIEFEEVEENA